MKVCRGTYFYLPCEKAHEILKSLDSSLNGGYTIADLTPADKLKVDGILFRKNRGEQLRKSAEKVAKTDKDFELSSKEAKKLL